MKLVTAVNLNESVEECISVKERPHEVSLLNTNQLLSEINGSSSMMKETKGGESALSLPSNDYPNGQIKKPETLNGAPQTSSPVKRIFEVSKSMSFDMTVKKVTIPPQWEKLSLNSSEEHNESKTVVSTNGISHESVCDEKNTAQAPEDGPQRTGRESVGMDFIDDSEQFGLSDSEVNKLLQDVDGSENAESSTEPGVRKGHGIEHSDNDSCSETITTAGDEDMCGNLNKSSVISDSFVSCSAKPESVQSGNSVLDGNDVCNTKHLKNVKVSEEIHDNKVDENTARRTNLVDSEKRKLVKSVEENKPYDTEILSDTESSHNSSAVEHENGKSSVTSSNSVVSRLRSSSEVSEEKGFRVRSFQGLDDDTGVEDSEAVLSNKSVDLELQSDETEQGKILGGLEMQQDGSAEPSEMVTDVEMQNDDTEIREHLTNVETQNDQTGLNEKSSDIETLNDQTELNEKLSDIEMQNDQTELNEKSSDIEMKNDQTELNEKSSDIETQNDQTELNEKSSDIEMQNDQTELNEKLSDIEIQNDQTGNLVEVGMQNCQNEHSVSSSDLEVQDCCSEGSADVHNGALHPDRKLISVDAQDDQTKLNEMSSDVDNQVGPNDMDCQVGNVTEDKLNHSEANVILPNPKDEDMEVEQDDKLYPLEKTSSETDIRVNVISVRVRDSSEVQAVSTDIKKNGRAVDEGNVLITEDSSKQSCSVPSKIERSLVEPEHAVFTGEADRLVRKRTTNLDSGDGAREPKRTRVENICSENLGSVSEGGAIFQNERDEGTGPATRSQREEAGGKAVSEDGEKISAMDKESNGMVGDSETNEDLSEVDRESGEMDKENSEKNSEVSVVYGQDSEGDKGSSEKDREICNAENDNADRDTSKDVDIENSCSKCVHEPVSLIEVKKVRIFPEMEKQLKLLEGKNVTAEKLQNEGEEKQAPAKSAPPKEPKSNLELAIERVATGLTDESETSKPPEPPQRLNPMPFMRDLHQNLLKKLSRNELEEFVVQKLCEVVTERCTLGDLRQRCQSLEQMLEQWRRKAQQLQKQVRDMEMVMKRYISDCRTRIERPIPVKITRSVGLQVHMGPLGPGMLRNRTLGSDNLRTPGQVMRRRVNRVSPPPVTAPVQQQQKQQQKQQQQQQQPPQQQPQQQQQQRQAQPVARTTPTNAVTVQKVVTPGFTKLGSTPTAAPQSVVPRAPITTLVSPMPASLKMRLSPKTIVTRPSLTTTTTTATSTGPMTSTTNTSNIVVNTTNSLRIATASQLNNRQPSKPPVCAPSKPNADLKVIDLTDEEDRSKSTGILRPAIATPAAITTNLIPSSSVTTAVPISSNPGIQTGSIRVVQPHQLTGTTAATILASSTSTTPTSRVAYFVPTCGGAVQQRQVLIASTPSPVRPGVMSVSSRQNQLPTLLFKNGTVVPIQQASGTAPVNTAAILRPGPPVQASQLQQVLNPTRTAQQIRVAPSLVTTVGRMTAPALTSINPVLGDKHPAPLPNHPVYQPSNINWKFAPPKPVIKVSRVANKHQQGILLSWQMKLTSEYEEIASYQLYAYQESSAPPSTTLWKKVGDVKALPLPMACTLTQFMEGHRYHFAVRAVDVHTRVGPFCTPCSILYLPLNKTGDETQIMQ